MKYIMYRGANQVSEVSNELAGCLSYYAKAEDALRIHRFVEKMVGTHHAPVDYLGNRFEVYREPAEEKLVEEKLVLKENINGKVVKTVRARVLLGYKDSTVGICCVDLDVLDDVFKLMPEVLSEADNDKITRMVTAYFLESDRIEKVTVTEIKVTRTSDSIFKMITL